LVDGDNGLYFIWSRLKSYKWIFSIEMKNIEIIG